MGIELKNLDKFCGYATPEKYSALVALYRVAMGNGISVQPSQSLLSACYLVTLYHN